MERSLTNYHIKLLAAVFMAIDHVGYVFFPDEIGFRILGRLSFPLFAWLLAQGEAHTRNLPRYALRLFVMGLISQPIYQLTFQVEDLNILFTLLVGLGCLRLARYYPPFYLPIWIGGSLLAEFANVDYGGYGIAAIVLLSLFRSHFDWWIGWVALHLILMVAVPDFGIFQFPAVFAALFVQAANHQPGKKARWFYLFYPGHLLALFAIEHWLKT